MIRAAKRPCAVCTKPFRNSSTTRYCSKACSHAATRTCRYRNCGRKFKLRGSRRQEYCSPDCKRAEFKAHRPKYHTNWVLQTKYGITYEQFHDILKTQGGGCAICKRKVHFRNGTKRREQRLFVDHDHETGVIRGVLCDHCNRGIGCFFDNPILLRAAATYLDRQKD